ncbi:hypothetical protein AVEN_24976-1 [Araneus ventricosus]|uniref:DUF7869 domain-containing protein n=1 Tax=Araneus ventricosus TaxID=182803 RepID=A0A4Y2THS5_ARAVE|nr:hypothetical protein AVEN_24976-1 [Araneus ventricosus]
MEGVAKKGANTVCSFLYHVIKMNFDDEKHERIILFSDACSGQNRNYMVFHFLCMLCRYLNVQIVHLFPVRGHSYCQCDRNSGNYSQRLKRMEVVETEQEYVDTIQSSRSPLFIMVDGM